jgi:hypothetical protein
MWTAHVTMLVVDWTCFSCETRSGWDSDFYLVLFGSLFASMEGRSGTV